MPVTFSARRDVAETLLKTQWRIDIAELLLGLSVSVVYLIDKISPAVKFNVHETYFS